MEHESVDQRQIERRMPGYVLLTDQRSNDHRNLFFLLFESILALFSRYTFKWSLQLSWPPSPMHCRYYSTGPVKMKVGTKIL